jgi:hypothetical protein
MLVLLLAMMVEAVVEHPAVQVVEVPSKNGERVSTRQHNPNPCKSIEVAEYEHDG